MSLNYNSWIGYFVINSLCVKNLFFLVIICENIYNINVNNTNNSKILDKWFVIVDIIILLFNIFTQLINISNLRFWNSKDIYLSFFLHNTGWIYPKKLSLNPKEAKKKIKLSKINIHQWFIHLNMRLWIRLIVGKSNTLERAMIESKLYYWNRNMKQQDKSTRGPGLKLISNSQAGKKKIPSPHSLY